MSSAAADASGQVMFNGYSWLVILAYLLLTTAMGHALSKKQMTIKDFFLGGRSLPWYAVCGSIIATELSAMTLVGIPAILWAATGNMTYGMISIGAIISRVIVAFWILPKYYEKEVYSPYEYIGNQLDARANRLTSYLFMIGGIMAQGTRVLLTAVVLQVVTGINIHVSIWLVGATAVLWTLMGGIATVIWTDLVQFLVLAFAAVLTLVIVVATFESADGESGVAAILSIANDAGKLDWFDWSWDPSKNYTIWTALIASTIGGLFAYGTDQMLMQRCFCCRNAREARKALLWSGVSQILTITCLFVGVGLWAFYQKSGDPQIPNSDEIKQIIENANTLVPVFIKYRVPWFFGGLMVAGIFAAAISSLDSILAALSQQTMAALGMKNGRTDKQNIRRGRVFVVLWAVVLCGMASLFHAGADNATLLIELALAVVGYISGAILGTFLIAAIPKLRRETEGIEWAAALSVMTIFAVTRHETWATIIISAASALLIITAMLFLLSRSKLIITKLLPFIGFIYFLNLYKFDGQNISLGWPWYAPLGCLVMLSSAMLICKPKNKAQDSRNQK